ncbi:hypothetical protein B9Z33_08495 [Limnohabitans sp. T6-20]|nr:hypothetical protein B9Z33_08495 [Limnohabitans sp. T6-20]
MGVVGELGALGLFCCEPVLAMLRLVLCDVLAAMVASRSMLTLLSPCKTTSEPACNTELSSLPMSAFTSKSTV